MSETEGGVDMMYSCKRQRDERGMGRNDVKTRGGEI